jgi:hypothetical protein
MSSIPQIFQNLHLKYKLKSTGTSTTGSDAICLQFNGDTGSNYQYTLDGFFGSGSTFGGGSGNTPTSFATAWQIYGLSQNLTNFPSGYGRVTIYNYAQATEAIGLFGESVAMQQNTGPVNSTAAGYWNNISARAAITSIVVGPSANQLLAGGYIDLYGELAGG